VAPLWVIFRDPDPNDTHTASVDWGDGTIEDADVLEFDGSGSVYASHIYRSPGTFNVTLTITDSDDVSASAALLVTVLNDAPSLWAIDDQSVEQGRAAFITTRLSDPDGGDEHTVMVDWGDGTIEPAFVARAREDGQWIIWASHYYMATGTHTVTITATDGGGEVASQSMELTVQNVAPVVYANGPLIRTESGQPITLYADFFDPGLDETFTFAWTAYDPSEQVVATGSDESFTFTPELPGYYRVRIEVTDQDYGYHHGWHTIGVDLPEPIEPPLVSGDPVLISDNPDDGVIIEWDDNSDDEDGFAIEWSADGQEWYTIESFTQPEHGTLTLNQNQTFRYEAPADFVGTVNFTCTLSDGTRTGTSAPIAIDVTNAAPRAIGQTQQYTTLYTFSIDEYGIGHVADAPLTGTLVAYDDQAGEYDELTYRITVQPRFGQVTLDGQTGAFSYQPNASYQGFDTFSFVANDGFADSNQAQVIIESRILMVAGNESHWVQPGESITSAATMPGLAMKVGDPQYGQVTYLRYTEVYDLEPEQWLPAGSQYMYQAPNFPGPQTMTWKYEWGTFDSKPWTAVFHVAQEEGQYWTKPRTRGGGRFPSTCRTPARPPTAAM